MLPNHLCLLDGTLHHSVGYHKGVEDSFTGGITEAYVIWILSDLANTARPKLTPAPSVGQSF